MDKENILLSTNDYSLEQKNKISKLKIKKMKNC